MSKIARVKFIRDKEPNIKALTAKNKVLDGALYVATDTGTLWMGISSSSLIQIKDNINTNTTYNLTKSGNTITLRGSDGSTFNVTDSNTVYGNATASAAGLMSAADKAKLDGVAAGSNHVAVDAELSTTSTNPVQNKVIKSALDGKSNTGHKHVKADITDFPTSMPASDVSAWAKAATKPSYSKAEVGLGNVDNTADSAKSVKYAASAGSASSATTAATANALKVTELTTQNLDDTKTVGLYFAVGTNSVKNKPTGVDAFGLEVKKTAEGYLVQVLTEGNINPMKTWIRQFNASAWSAWAHYFDSNHAPTWSQVSGKPSFATVATSGSYNDLSNKPTIPTIPGSLKNPNALTISLNGTSQGAYDGSAVKNINITASSVGAAASSHTHTKAQITDFPTSMPASDVYSWAKQSSKPSYTISEVSGNLPASRISGTIAAANLPSYVDDVLEYASISKFPTTGESGKIYTALDTNKIYRWSGSAYVVISETIALGTTHSSAGYGDESRAAYNHSTKTSGNPHHVTKADVGLGSVDNTADSAKSVKYAASAGSASSATTAATANALKVTELTTQNLDDTKTVGLYFAVGTNSVKNKPTGVDAFGLEVKKTAEGYLVQVLTEGNINPMKTWIRQFNASAWSAWAHYFDSNHAPTWSQVSGKPSFATVATSGSYNDLSNKPTIPTIPGSLKNPNALTISLNGTSQGAYDGSAVKNINITASSVGAAASSHTHTKAQITDFPTSMPASDVYSWAKQSSKPSYTISEVSGNLPASRISGTIAAANLPSYVDDVLEYASISKFPTTGESGKIYTALDTNKIYRWSGSAYVVISETIALGTTHSSAGYGDESRAAYNHSTKTSGNPHHVTKADVGLGSVDNTADSAKSVKYATSAGSVAWSNVTGRPTIPSVGNGTVTITQNGTNKGSFTLNQSGNATIALTDTNTNTWRPEEVIVSSSQPNASTCKLWIKV